MTRFYQFQSQPLSLYTAVFEYNQTTTQPSGTSSSTNIASNAVNAHWVVIYTHSTDTVHPSSVWPTTGYGASLDIVTTGADLTYATRLDRITDDGTTLRVSGPTQTALSGTGIKSHTSQSWATVNDTSPSDQDHFALLVMVSNANMMTAQTTSLDSADTWLECTNFGSGPPPSTEFEGWGIPM